MKNKIILVALMPLLFSSCTNGSFGPRYKEETINVYYADSKNDTTCSIRYYGSSVIPYISIKDYHQLLYRGRKYDAGRDRFDINQKDGVYTITVAGDYKATFDVMNNKMESPDLWSFKNTNLTGYGDVSSASYDGLPFVKVASVEFSGEAKPTTIDFSKYNLKLYGEEGAIYIPIVFATNLFSNENILQGAYNNKDLFIFNVTENETLENFGSKYYDSMYLKPFNQEYSDYVYNELCLDFDIFLGRPGRSSLEIYYDLSKGLDEALKARPLGRTIIEYMKSNDLAKFLVGSSLLGYLHQDGGHSSYSTLAAKYYDESKGKYVSPIWLTDEVEKQSQALIKEQQDKNYEEIINYDKAFGKRGAVRKQRSEILNKPNGEIKGTDTYTKDGDVAYIHIDGFMGEIALRDEWDKYYNGQRKDIPFGKGVGGAVGAISYGVREASKDSEVKHIVIDLASNSGGSTDEMFFMIGLLTGSHKAYFYNSMSDNYNITTYDFDFNFDKKFDAEDDAVLDLLKDKDISVLTTRNGFSCGGISPIYLHDEGLFTIGEECGGGSCSVYMQYDGYGNFLRSSSPSMSVTKNKVNIDIARKTVCDSPLIFPTKDNVRNYSALYNTEVLRNLIINHYND